MAKLRIDQNAAVGKIKPMHGVGQPPFEAVDFSMFHYLTEAGIPFSRLHDTGGYLGGGRFVDIPNLFRDFDADPDDPKSYDFAFTDLLITAIVKSGVEVFFRLGVTIENQPYVKTYRIDPPADNLQWAKICAGVIRHYTQGWANGFNYNIKYWEIWNEPDNSDKTAENQMWTGSAEQYYELYGVASKYLKKLFPELKIGGFASCGFYALKAINAGKEPNSREKYFYDFFDGFLDYIKKNGCPLDFFSWHSYDNVPNTVMYADYARKKLDQNGYASAEHSCNEWNCEVNSRGTIHHAALTGAMMLAMQNTTLDSAMFYDARLGVSVYGSLFNPMTKKPLPSYYSFMAFNELYKRGTQLEASSDDGGVYIVAAKNDGLGCCAVIANISGSDVPLELYLGDKKLGAAKLTGCRGIDSAHVWEDRDMPETLENDSVLFLTFDA